MAKKKTDEDVMRVCVLIDVSVSRASWMEKYGDYIVSHGIVPEVTLAKAAKKAVAEKFNLLNIKNTEIK